MECHDECETRAQAARMMELAKSQRKALAEIYELADPRATTPTQDMEQIRIKASVALRTAAQLGLMP
jgi:hypothetical protein